MKWLLILVVALLLACNSQTKVKKMHAVTFITPGPRLIVVTKRIIGDNDYAGYGAFVTTLSGLGVTDDEAHRPDTITVLYPDSEKVYRYIEGTHHNSGKSDSLIVTKDTVWQPE